MVPFKFTILFLLSYAAVDVTYGQEHDYNNFEDPRECLKYQQLLPLLPYRGWDNLNYNASKEIIFTFQYANCKLALNDFYLVPDGLKVDFLLPPVNDGKRQVQFDVLVDWKRYVPLQKTRVTVKQHLLYYSDIQGTFSSHYQKTKRLIVLNDTVIVRTQFVKRFYIIIVDPEIRKFSPQFRRDLITISEHVANDDRKLAYHYADLLVQKYGTNVIEEMTVGGILAVEDVLPRSFVDVNDQLALGRLRNMATSAFFQRFSTWTENTTEKSTPEEIEKYKKAVIQSEIFVIGGNKPENSDKLQLLDWENSVYQNPAVLAKRGEFLNRLILIRALSHLPSPLIDVLSRTVFQAIMNYHRYNLRQGCTDVEADNFDFAANSEDNSCSTDASTFAFGGLYQTCTEYPSDLNICAELEQKNPITGQFSCPENFQTAVLRSHVYQKDILPDTPQICAKNVSKSFLFEDSEQLCIPESSAITVNYTTYWCYSFSLNSSGVPFGGLYSTISVNTKTGNKTCPVDYSAVKIGKDIIICIGQRHVTSTSVKFGGFFSCDRGNPFTTNSADPNSWNRGCPRGYSIRVAFIENGCIIEYCIRNEDILQNSFQPLINPVRDVTSSEKIDKATLLIVDKHRKYQRRSRGDPWIQKQLSYKEYNSSLQTLLDDVFLLPTTVSEDLDRLYYEIGQFNNDNNSPFPSKSNNNSTIIVSKHELESKSTDISGSGSYDGNGSVSHKAPTSTIIRIFLFTAVFPALALSVMS